jgi:hypothetical protein
VIIIYRLLGHYVEAACKNDMNTFASSVGCVSSSLRIVPASYSLSVSLASPERTSYRSTRVPTEGLSPIGAQFSMAISAIIDAMKFQVVA